MHIFVVFYLSSLLFTLFPFIFKCWGNCLNLPWIKQAFSKLVRLVWIPVPWLFVVGWDVWFIRDWIVVRYRFCCCNRVRDWDRIAVSLQLVCQLSFHGNILAKSTSVKAESEMSSFELFLHVTWRLFYACSVVYLCIDQWINLWWTTFLIVPPCNFVTEIYRIVSQKQIRDSQNTPDETPTNDVVDIIPPTNPESGKESRKTCCNN